MNHQTGETSTYQYNGLGHRVGKTIGSPVEPNLPTSKLQELREYAAHEGRFIGEDVIKGNGAYPFTLNPYAYCWSSPMGGIQMVE